MFQLKSKSTFNIFNLWGLHKSGLTDKALSESRDLNNEASYINDDSQSLGLPQSDYEGEFSEDEDLSPTLKNRNHGVIDLKAAQKAYYLGVNSRDQ